MAGKPQTLDFAPNYCHVIELDVTPEADAPTWKSALVGITEAAPANDETVDEDDFYDSLGYDESTVSKVKPSIAITGYRKYGDPVQDFVQSRALRTGEDRKTRYRWTHPDGTRMEGSCTLRDIVPGSGMGESSAKGDFTYTIAINSVDVWVEGEGVHAPESVTAQDVTASTASATPVEASVEPATANQKVHYAIDDEGIATVDADGNVKGVKSGSTVLTIKAASKPSVVKQVKVTVSA